MSAVSKLFVIGFRQVIRDGMLLVLLPAPFLMGAALCLLLPAADSYTRLNMGFPLSPWFALSDGFVMSIAAVMVALVFAFLMLEERDEGMGIYYSITPAGGLAYLAARLVIPMGWAFIAGALVVHWFGLAVDSVSLIAAMMAIGTLQGVIVCMLLVIYAGNKVEGLALSKLTNLLLLGLPAAWFLDTPARLSFAFLPSFWLGELTRAATVEHVLPVERYLLAGFLISAVWIGVLTRKFLSRVG